MKKRTPKEIIATTPNITLQDIIKIYRQGKGLTLTAMADKINAINGTKQVKQHIWQYENGTRNISMMHFVAFCTAFKLKAEMMITPSGTFRLVALDGVIFSVLIPMPKH